MTYKIVNFNVIDNSSISTISVTYNIYSDDGNIFRSNMRQSFTINNDPTFTKEDGSEVKILDVCRDISSFILSKLEQS